ncbi:MAG: DUF1559 domain-containing protein [Pirellulales bacterium]|nr:DUF1559 domain-containing protein [Pirellulales bacterium]
MPITVTCSGCNRQYRVRDELAGKTAKCACGCKLTIPGRDTAVPPVLQAAEPEASEMPAASGDPFAQMTDAAAQAGPLQPLPQRKRARRKGPNKTLLLALGGVAVVGCLIGGIVWLVGHSPVADAFKPKEPRWKSPEEVVQAWKQAKREGDWRLYFEVQSPEKQEDLLRNVAATAQFNAADCPTLKQLCRRYGFKPVGKDSLPGSFEEERDFYQQVRKKIRKMSESDRTNMFVEAVEIFRDEKKLPDPPRELREAIAFWKGQKTSIDEFALLNVEFKGDYARGDWGTRDPKDPTRLSSWTTKCFARIDGEWRIADDEVQDEFDPEDENPSGGLASSSDSGEKKDAPASKLTREQEEEGVRGTLGNLKAMGIALHQYHNQHGAFPTQANTDAQGKPLLSWRVHLLPFLGEGALYRRFHLDEPWDSPHNRELLREMPDVFRSPFSKVAGEHRTVYVRPTGPGTACDSNKRLTLRHLNDGTSGTLFILETDDSHAVAWTQPADLPFDPNNPLRGIDSIVPRTRCFACMADGSAMRIPRRFGAPQFVAGILINDGKSLEDGVDY